MAKMSNMVMLYNNYCSGSHPMARMLTIYIEESSDGKGINEGKEKPIKDFHKTIEDRAFAANKFVNDLDFKCEVVLDDIDNNALKSYDAHPERICIIQHGAVVHIGGKPGSLVYYDIDDIIAWLAARDTRPKVADGKEQEGEEVACKT